MNSTHNKQDTRLIQAGAATLLHAARWFLPAQRIRMKKQQSWNDLWIREQERGNISGNKHECWHSWNEENAARDFLNAAKKNPAVKERIANICALLPVGGKVLDIGAGPGIIAVPLASKVALVTAVEPAAGMAALLREQVASSGAANIALVQKRWDDVIPATDLEPPYGVTVASFSLGMIDLRSSIEKMNAVTQGSVVIYWHYGEQSWEEDSRVLWQLLHGREFSPVPKSDLVCRVLNEMGIVPETNITTPGSQTVYKSFDEALDQFARRYQADNETRRSLLANYLKNRLIAQGEQFVLPRHDSSMRIIWKVEKK